MPHCIESSWNAVGTYTEEDIRAAEPPARGVFREPGPGIWQVADAPRSDRGPPVGLYWQQSIPIHPVAGNGSSSEEQLYDNRVYTERGWRDNLAEPQAIPHLSEIQATASTDNYLSTKTHQACNSCRQIGLKIRCTQAAWGVQRALSVSRYVNMRHVCDAVGQAKS
ncbi:hypothetical protein B0H14DRAFT_3132902 [Mycena olivaceomarginata]|nr:hypothetical protein B0H14DRAFT_3132902 [Mycena olivaceomarginata]